MGSVSIEFPSLTSCSRLGDGESEETLSAKNVYASRPQGLQGAPTGPSLTEQNEGQVKDRLPSGCVVMADSRTGLSRALCSDLPNFGKGNK